MIKLNWKIRFQSKTFLTALIAFIFTLSNQVANIFGYDITIISEELTAVTETILLILVLIGVIHDGTTPGLSDSQKSLLKERLK